jgi:RNA polymerase sigma factor (sigma-70 family)
MIDLENVDSAAAERLQQIDQEEWGDIYLELLDFARDKAKGLDFVKGGGELPLGTTPDDLAQEAIHRLFDGRRKWNPEQDPDLCDYLKSVVSSLQSALLEKAGYQRDSGNAVEEHVEISSSENSEFNDCLDALESIINESAAGDDDLQIVKMGMEDGMKSAEIAEVLGIEVGRVYDLSRKLKRRVRSRMRDHACSDHWAQMGY